MDSTTDPDIHIKPTTAIDSDHKEVRHVALELTSSFPGVAEKAQALFYFVRDRIHYSVYMISTNFEDFVASTILRRGKGYCVQKAVLLAALARAAGIPSRHAFARIRNHKAPRELIAQTGLDVIPSHGYTQLLLGNRWISLTGPPSTESFAREVGCLPLNSMAFMTPSSQRMTFRANLTSSILRNTNLVLISHSIG